MSDRLSGIGILDPFSSGSPVGSGGGGRGLADLAADSEPNTPKRPGLLARIGQIVTGIPGGMMQLGSDLVRMNPVSAAMDGPTDDGFDFGKKYPAVFGIGKGFQQTATHIPTVDAVRVLRGGDSRILRDYSDDPVGAALNDVGNVATVASLGAAALGTSSVAGAVGASRAATVAGRLEQVAAAGNKVASLPAAPWRYALTSASERAGQWGLRAAEANPGSAIAQGMVRFSPDAKALQQAVLQGQAAERQVMRGVDPHSEQAGILRGDVQQQTALSLSKMPFAKQVDAYDATEVVRGAGKPGLSMDDLAKLDEADRLGQPQPVWDNSPPTGEGGAFTSLGEASKGRFKGELADETVIPNPLAKELQRMQMDPNTLPGARAMGSVLDPTNRVYRMLRMDLNPGWAVGQAPGNLVMGMAQDPHPIGFAQRYVEAFRSGKFTDDPRIQRTAVDTLRDEQRVGFDGEALPQPTGIAARIDEGLTKVEGTLRKGRLADLADRLDNSSRTAFYEGRIADGDSPAVAQEKTLRQMGEFDKRNAVEQAYVRRLAPFYTWNREIVKMTGHLAEEHPVRFAAMANQGRVSADARDEGPGKRTVDGGFLVPFGQTGDKFGGALFGAGKMLGPVPKLAAMWGTGDSMSTGKDLRVGQDFGERNGPGLHNTKEALSTINRGLPIARLANAAKGKNRYQTGTEASVSFLTGVDVGHTPTQRQLNEEAETRAAERKAKKAANASLSKAARR